MTSRKLIILQLYWIFEVSHEYQNQAKCKEQVERNDYHPIRISVDYIGFEEKPEHEEQFKLLRESALPRVISYWGETLMVRQTVGDWLLYERPCTGFSGVYCIQGLSDDEVASQGYECGDVKLPITANDMDSLDLYECWYTEGDDIECNLSETLSSGIGGSIMSSFTDLKLHVVNRISESTEGYHSLGKVKAQVATCGKDECGRPTIGVLEIFSALFTYDLDIIVTTLIHEFTHILGFEIDSMNNWVSIETGEFLLPLEKRFRPMYLVGKDNRKGGDITVEFHKRDMILTGFQDATLYIPTIPYNVVKNIGGDEYGRCTCPIDPNQKYTDEDIFDCVSDASGCLFAITSPNVIEAVKKYYNCESAMGMPLHVEIKNPFFLNPHWKFRYLIEELMNPAHFGMPQFVSIITMGLLKDSGWYQVNEEYGASTIEPGIAWGNQDGCDILFKNYVDETTEMIVALPHTKKEFTGKNAREYKQYGTCFSSAFGYGAFVPNIILPEKQNQKFGLTSSQRVTCTKFANNYQSRCIDTVDSQGTPQPICVEVICNPDLLTYSFVAQSNLSSSEIHCHTDEQRVEAMETTYICRDPRIICARLNYKHHLPSSGLNSPPGIAPPQRDDTVSLQDVSFEISELGHL